MKEFIIAIYNTIGTSGIIVAITSLTLLILNVINTVHLIKLREKTAGIQFELDILRKEKDLHEQGKGYYK